MKFIEAFSPNIPPSLSKSLLFILIGIMCSSAASRAYSMQRIYPIPKQIESGDLLGRIVVGDAPSLILLYKKTSTNGCYRVVFLARLVLGRGRLSSRPPEPKSSD